MGDKHILDLSKTRESSTSISPIKQAKRPNLSFGVKVKRVKGKDSDFVSKKKKGLDIRPRIPDRRKIKSIRSRKKDRADFAENIDDIWKKSKKSDRTRFDKRPARKRRKKLILFIVIFLVFLTGVTISGLYFFGSRKLTGQGVVLEIKGNENIISGEGVELRIKYKNKENVKVKNIGLRLNYPDGFYFISSEPYATILSSNVWELEDLKPDESGEIELIGQVIGEKGEELVLEAVLSYEPSNFSSVFMSKISKIFKIENVLLDFNIEAPEEIGNNNRVTYNVIYKNISKAPLDNFRLKMDYPDNFTFIEAQGDAELLTGNMWLIEDIQKEEEQRVAITGFFDLENISSSTVNAILEIKSLIPEIPLAGEANPNWYTYLIVEKSIRLSELLANLKVSINNEETDTPIDWGDELNYQINYKNNSDSAIENVSIKITLNSDYIDWESVEDDFNGFLDEGSNSIVWDKRVVPSLGKIDIGQESRIDFKIKIFDFKEDYIGKEDYVVNSEATLNCKSLEDNNKEAIGSNVIVNKINSFVEFLTLARYYGDAGQEVGSGPLPPVVGETTSYQILWQIKSITNNLSKVMIKTTLPPGVEWGQGVVADDQSLIFNNETKQVVWQIDSLSKGKDNIAKFSVLITPDETQVGKIMTLNNTIVLSADDNYSKGRINLNNNYLTTELEGDDRASGNGKVIDLGL